MKVTKQTTYQKLVKSSEKSKWEDYFKFHLKVAGLPTPAQQFMFAQSTGHKWRTDFAWPSYKIIVEIEGGIWRKDQYGNWAGAHTHPMNVLRDIEKYNHVALYGYRLFRFSPDDLKTGKAIKMMELVFSKLKI